MQMNTKRYVNVYVRWNYVSMIWKPSKKTYVTWLERYKLADQNRKKPKKNRKI